MDYTTKILTTGLLVPILSFSGGCAQLKLLDAACKESPLVEAIYEHTMHNPAAQCSSFGFKQQMCRLTFSYSNDDGLEDLPFSVPETKGFLIASNNVLYGRKSLGIFKQDDAQNSEMGLCLVYRVEDGSGNFQTAPDFAETGTLESCLKKFHEIRESSTSSPQSLDTERFEKWGGADFVLQMLKGILDPIHSYLAGLQNK
ncbi:hypothetical protein H6501_00740 [Candidatus Woesearchaeota archaeon]|nr:hypothetical protein [Nanoarchaeota archaeon]MCB9370104.1 hypothetical protein [Candidatus Woesearchaeota archaeon]USN44635.1 MAG: hypothetical protein H6500_02215 [Candidatus Woesearchaeota archaeon]